MTSSYKSCFSTVSLSLYSMMLSGFGSSVSSITNAPSMILSGGSSGNGDNSNVLRLHTSWYNVVDQIIVDFKSLFQNFYYFWGGGQSVLNNCLPHPHDWLHHYCKSDFIQCSSRHPTISTAFRVVKINHMQYTGKPFDIHSVDNINSDSRDAILEGVVP